MMRISELIRSLTAAGATPEAIAIAVEAVEEAQSGLDAVREKARLKKREQRAKAAVAKDGGDSPETVAGLSRDTAGTVPSEPPSPSPSSPQTPHQPHPPTPAETPRTRKAGHLPADWQPAPATGQAAMIVPRWEPGRIERELSKFRDHWAAASGQQARKRDWDAAWRNWIVKADEIDGRSRNGNGGRGGWRESGWASRTDGLAGEPASLDD